jgi:alpha-methylacyl-CoA racemase
MISIQRRPKPLQPLKGIRILSLSLNLPGPAALLRCQHMGARCVKLEPPVPAQAPQGVTGDPMSVYSRRAYDALHAGIRVMVANLKTEVGQKALHRALSKADVLLTSFRPSALSKLGLEWKTLHQQYPALSVVTIVGAAGARAEQPGHDLTYQAENHLVPGLDLPPTLYADMGGALMASEAILQAVLLQRQKGIGSLIEVALSDAAAHLALPHTWGVTVPGTLLGGNHAGYRVYPCKDGRVAIAALEPHFAESLCVAAGITWCGPVTMLDESTHLQVARFLVNRTRKSLNALATKHDIPLHTLPKI